MPLCPAVQGIVRPCTYKTHGVNTKTLPCTEIVRRTGATARHHDKRQAVAGSASRHRRKVCTGCVGCLDWNRWSRISVLKCATGQSWSAWRDSNPRHPGPRPGALVRLSYTQKRKRQGATAGETIAAPTQGCVVLLPAENEGLAEGGSRTHLRRFTKPFPRPCGHSGITVSTNKPPRASWAYPKPEATGNTAVDNQAYRRISRAARTASSSDSG